MKKLSEKIVHKQVQAQKKHCEANVIYNMNVKILVSRNMTSYKIKQKKLCVTM